MKHGGLDNYLEKSNIKFNLEQEQQNFDKYLDKLKTGEASMFTFMNNNLTRNNNVVNSGLQSTANPSSMSI